MRMPLCFYDFTCCLWRENSAEKVTSYFQKYERERERE